MTTSGTFAAASVASRAGADLRARLLPFWFRSGNERNWFMGSTDFDREISENFAQDLDRASNGDYDHLHDKSAEDSLSLVILMDQFSRNIFRGQARAFELDDKTSKLVVDGLSKGYDKELTDWKLRFYIMPLMHAENLEMQQKSVELTRAYGFPDEFAVSHLDVIEKFGRFPHRNATLGRTNTPEEEGHLAADTTGGWGQGKK